MNAIKSVLALLIITLAPSLASAEVVKRDILAVTDGADIKEEYDNLIANYAEMPLNHLGFKLTYVDAAGELPSDDEMGKYAGIVSWFTDNKLDGARAYAEWITRQLGRGLKLVVLDDFGFEIEKDGTPVPTEILDRFFKAFSISYDPDGTTTSPLLIEVVENDPAMTEFERKLSGDLTYFAKIAPLDKGAKVYLKLKRKDTGAVGDAVFVHSKGGFVMGEYALYLNPINFQTRWRIDPFKFFSRAFNANFPKPDVTTLNGTRVLMSQVDGDGLRNMSYSERRKNCGELAYEKIFSQFEAPVTVSIVVGDLVLAGERERNRLYKTIKKTFALPNIEPASHGWTHPMVWNEKGRNLAYKLKGFYYSPKNEIGYSLEYINKYLVPKGKEAKIFLWTGDCLPDKAALKYTYEDGIMNINGGDTRLDDKFNSYTYVSPLFRHVGGYLQNYAPDSNEYIYTNNWTGPYYGYRSAIETFRRTESPMRVKPIDVYYHFYVVEYDIALNSILDVYRWALAQEHVPLFATDYVELLNGFLSTKIERNSPSKWIVRDSGGLRTVRFDDMDLNVDMAKSKGVAGFLHYQGSLYVHLDNGKVSEIELTKSAPAQPFLEKANGRIMSWNPKTGGVDFTLYTMGKAAFTLKGLKKDRAYDVEIKGKKYKPRAGADGRLAFSEDILGNAFEEVGIALREAAQ